jgi:hypothetical protein
MAHSCSYAMGYSILDELKSQISLGPPSLNAQTFGKLMNVGRVGHGRPTLLTTTKGGQSS